MEKALEQTQALGFDLKCSQKPLSFPITLLLYVHSVRLTSCLKSLLLTQSKGGGAAGFVTSTGDRVLLPHGPQDLGSRKKTFTKQSKTVHICKPSSLPKFWSVLFCFICFAFCFCCRRTYKDRQSKIKQIKFIIGG